MKLQAFLFLLYLAIFSDIITSAIGGYMLWSYRKNNGSSRMVMLLAGVMFAIFFEGIMVLIANGFGYETRPVFTAGYAWSYWVGRGTRSVMLWMFVLHMLGRKSV